MFGIEGNRWKEEIKGKLHKLLYAYKACFFLGFYLPRKKQDGSTEKKFTIKR